jgi:hypothetical protein
MDKPAIQISKWKKGNEMQSKNFGGWTKYEHCLFVGACIQHGWGKWKRIEKNIPTRDRNQVKSHARCIGIDVKQRIIRDHSNYKRGKKTEKIYSSTNKHHDKSTKVDSASIIDKTTMSSNDGVADKGDRETAGTSGVEKLNNIDASTIEIHSDDCGSDDYEMTFESGAMTSNDNDTDNYKAANATTSNDCNSNDIDDDSTGDDEGYMSDINPSICKNDKDKHSDKGNSPCRSARIKMKHDQVQTAVDGLLALSIRGSNGVPMLFKGVHIAPV